MCNSLSLKIASEIKKKGPLSFSRFMQEALYAPTLGYYMSEKQKFGETGDFVTAPELSSLFSRCIARFCYGMLPLLEQPIILEFGAGSGVMAVDLLLELERLNSLPEFYWILEISPVLQRKQERLVKQRIPHLFNRVKWLSDLPLLPFTAVVLANEVIDAMPVSKFRVKDHDHLEEAYVDLKADSSFSWYWSAASPFLQEAVERLDCAFSSDYESEINLLIGRWVSHLADRLESGVVLIIDYGFPRREYYHPDRFMGTIVCHYRHRVHSNPLIFLGLQDITAHVDFTAMADAAMACGFDMLGYTHQAAFLIDCGMTDLLATVEEKEYFNQSSQVKRLTLPSEMGELFKVMSFSKNMKAPALGFQTFNQLDRL